VKARSPPSRVANVGAARNPSCTSAPCSTRRSINTDQLDDLQAFLLENDPQPSTPYVSWWEKVRRPAA
jgi:hypothetical protein